MVVMIKKDDNNDSDDSDDNSDNTTRLMTESYNEQQLKIHLSITASKFNIFSLDFFYDSWDPIIISTKPNISTLKQTVQNKIRLQDNTL